MGTRSMIAIARPRGYHAIYCHWDGYPDGVGAMLLAHYSGDEAKREALIALGDIPSLREEIGERHPFDVPYDQEDPHPTWTRAYGRDRGDTDVKASRPRTFKGLARTAFDRDAEWLYVWLDEVWLYCPVRKDPALMDLIVLTVPEPQPTEGGEG